MRSICLSFFRIGAYAVTNSQRISFHLQQTLELSRHRFLFNIYVRHFELLLCSEFLQEKVAIEVLQGQRLQQEKQKTANERLSFDCSELLAEITCSSDNF